MKKTELTVFLCTDKDCSKSWRRICDGSPGKWLRRSVEEAGLPFKIDIVKTECMDRCAQAACLWVVHGTSGQFECNVRSECDLARIHAAFHQCATQGRAEGLVFG